MKCCDGRLPVLLAALSLPWLGACSASEDPPAPETAATWEVDPGGPPQADSKRISALVTRVGCAGGKTGTVRKPVVREENERVVVTFSVEPLPRGDYDCPGNRPVAKIIELDHVLGQRVLLDGSCPPPTTTCDPVQRWPAPGKGS